MYDIPYLQNLKRNDTSEFIYKIETDSQTQRMNDGCRGGREGRNGGEGRVREFGIDRYILLYLKRITNKDLLYGTGNTAQCYVAAWTGGQLGGEMDTCMCMAELLCCATETITALLFGYNSILNKKFNEQ